jgi:hypothetical protein
MNNVNILVEAKKEYTTQLQKVLRPRIYEGFKSIYEDIINISAKELEENKVQNNSLTKAFQKILKEIPQWNYDMINNEFDRIVTLSGCDYFDSLIEAVFITNTKILTSVQINESKPLNIKINIPQPSHFIHKCYMKCANEFYKNPYVFDLSKNISPKEKHNNLREALSLIDLSISNAISDLLPIGDILKQGLTKNNNNVEYEEEYKHEFQPQNSKDDQQNHDDEKDDEEDEEDDEEDDDDDEDDEEQSVLENNEVIETKKEEVNDIIIKTEEKVEDKKEIEEKVIEIPKMEEKETKEVINLNEDNNENVKVNEIISNTLTSVPEEKPEYKEIVYSKVTPPFVSKIKNVEKKNENVINLTDVEPIYEPKKSIITPFKPLIVQNKPAVIQNNQFIKKIKNTKFKNKLSGGANRENNSFYKKKYEENSANYISISDNLKDNIINTLDDLKSTQNSIKIIKNKINIDDASSDEEGPSIINLE